MRGSGFDRDTRLVLILDTGNRRALFPPLATLSVLESAVAAGQLVYLANNYRGVQVIDFSDPERPRQIGTLKIPGKAWKIALNGRYAYVAAKEGGIQVLDIADPANLRLLGGAELGGLALDVVLAGNRAYVANSRLGLQVVDIANPAHPRLLATLPVPGHPFALAVNGETAYLAAAERGLQVVDLHDPQRPRVIGSLQTVQPVFGVAARDGMVYLAAGSAGLAAVDVSNPVAPALLETIDTPGTARAIALAGDHAYLADNVSGLQVVDLADPRRPRFDGAYELPGLAQSVAVTGDRALVAMGRKGLQAVDLRQKAIRRPPFFTARACIADFVAAGARAYLAAGARGVLVLNTRDPFRPRLISSLPLPGSARSVLPAGNFLYVIEEGSRKAEGEVHRFIQAVDIGDPRQPQITATVKTMHSPQQLAVAGSNLWAVGNEGLCRFDLTEPGRPRPAGCLPLPAEGRSVTIDGRLILVGDARGSLHVIDPEPPETPHLLGSVDLPWHLQAFSAAEKIVVSGHLALVADGRNGLLVFDIAAPQRPRLVGDLQLPAGGFAHGVTVIGRRAYVADFRRGLYLVDLGEPENPQILATLGISAPSRQIVLEGNQVIFANGEEGLLALPLPFEPTELKVESTDRLSITLPPQSLPGSYTLRAFNGYSDAELPGAVTFQ